jgi:hypothetical protein
VIRLILDENQIRACVGSAVVEGQLMVHLVPLRNDPVAHGSDLSVGESSCLQLCDLGWVVDNTLEELFAGRTVEFGPQASGYLRESLCILDPLELDPASCDGLAP